MLIALCATAPANAASVPHLFGSEEVRSSDLRYFPKWTGMLERYRHEASAACAGDAGGGCPVAHWGRFIDGLRGAEPLD